MKCLVVIAHPVPDSLCQALARRVVAALAAAGHDVMVEDLSGNGFAPALTRAERQGYYQPPCDQSAVQPQVERLLAAEALVLVFPTWWFGFPAILKGWFDRVWLPGVAYDHADDLGPIRPRLLGLRRALAVTSLGAPGWVDRLLMRQPVKRVLKTALLGTCAPKCRLEMLSLYKAERLTPPQVEAFARRVEQALARWH